MGAQAILAQATIQRLTSTLRLYPTASMAKTLAAIVLLLIVGAIATETCEGDEEALLSVGSKLSQHKPKKGGKGKGPKPGKTEESCAQYGANCQPMTGAACYGSVHTGNIGPNGGLTCCCSAGGGGLGTSSMGGSGGMFDMFGSGNSDPFSGNSGPGKTE